MMAPKSLQTGLLLAQLKLAWGMALLPRQQVTCDYKTPASSGDTCTSLAAEWGLTEETFASLNPATAYPTLVAGQSYCVVGTVSATASTTSSSYLSTSSLTTSSSFTTSSSLTTSSSFTTSTVSLTTTTAANGITTPTPNPAVGSSCVDLGLGYYVCVDTIDYTTATSTSSPGNGITTPTPDEPGMVSDCTKFWLVGSGDTCASIASSEGITVAEIEKWNSQVGSACTDIWLGYYICVGV